MRNAYDFGYFLRDQALNDAQDVATGVLYAEAKLGELLKANPPSFQRGNSGQIKQNPLPSGITQKQSHYAQELAGNIDIDFGIGDWLVDGKRHYGDGLYQEAERILELDQNYLS